MKSPKEIVDAVAAVLSKALGVDEPAIELAEGQPVEVQCARPGKFTDRYGQSVTFTETDLAQLASAEVDPEEALLKIGHTPIETDTPDYGRVTKLRFDEGEKRLYATVVPTPAMVEKNRKEGFRRVSMEVAGKREGEKSVVGPFRFLHLAFLGARKPAISGLAPAALAALAGENVFVADDETEVHVEFAEKTLDKPATVRATQEPKKEPQMSEEKHAAELATANKLAEDRKAENDRLIARLALSAKETAKAFMTANVKRIPFAVRARFEARLCAALADPTPAVLEFSIAGKAGEEPKTVKQTEAEFLMELAAGLPEQVGKDETTETATNGAETEVEASAPAGTDEGSVVIDLAARKEQRDAKAKGEEISYLEAVRRVENRGTK